MSFSSNIFLIITLVWRLYAKMAENSEVAVQSAQQNGSPVAQNDNPEAQASPELH